MQKILVIFKKQLRDTVRNKTILIQFILFPLLTLIMENAVTLDNMPEHFFTKLFAVMYIGMAPVTSVASVISEEKEKDTLRVLMMANIKPWQYLIGVGTHVWTICMLGALLMSTGLPASERPFFLTVMAIGFIISVILGACIGIASRNQMMATSLVMPVMMVLSFAPMLAMFNDIIKKGAAVFYTQQLKTVFDEMSWSTFSAKNITVICLNVIVFVLLFAVLYRKKGLE
ncbi:MAG: ABC transporter permease [Clostridiales bacterium]|nr:ABC transporter permease [Clostridiales bacterium]